MAFVAGYPLSEVFLSAAIQRRGGLLRQAVELTEALIISIPFSFIIVTGCSLLQYRNGEILSGVTIEVRGKDQAGQLSMTKILAAQLRYWQEAFVRNPDIFGTLPSNPARTAAEIFKNENKTAILELGGGQGRDTVFLARNGFRVTVLDYSESAVGAIADKARKLSLTSYITVCQQDVRAGLPFADESMDGCYSHMLYCMALTTPELEFLSREVKRVLRPNGLHIYTVRHIKDPHHGKWIHLGEDLYEVGGFIVHFFSRAMVDHLAEGFEIVSIDELEEGELPRKLFLVTLRKR